MKKRKRKRERKMKMTKEQLLEEQTKTANDKHNTYNECRFIALDALINNTQGYFEIKITDNKNFYWTLHREAYVKYNENIDLATLDARTNIPLEKLKEITDKVNTNNFIYSEVENKTFKCDDINTIYIVLGIE